MNKRNISLKLVLAASLVIAVAYCLIGLYASSASANSANGMLASGPQGPQQMDGLWTDTTEGAIRQSQSVTSQADVTRVMPWHYRVVTLNRDLLTERLAQAPQESDLTLTSFQLGQSM